MHDQQHRAVPMAALTPLMAEVLAQGGAVEVTVTGNSMWPMLRHRVSRVRLAPAATLARGDIPLYRRDDGAYVLHRVIAREESNYICCGDNQWTLEPGIRDDQVLAVMTHFTRGDRWVSCRSGWYQMYWRVWVWIRPLRRLFFGGFVRVRRWLRRYLK